MKRKIKEKKFIDSFKTAIDDDFIINKNCKDKYTIISSVNDFEHYQNDSRWFAEVNGLVVNKIDYYSEHIIYKIHSKFKENLTANELKKNKIKLWNFIIENYLP